MIESYKWDWIGNLCRHWFLEHRFAVPITAFFNCLPSSSSSSSASSSPSSSPSAGLPSTGAIESKQPRLRSKTAKELQIIKKNIKDLSVNERWLPIKCLKADCTIDKLANVALTWNYCQLIQLHYNYIMTERSQVTILKSIQIPFTKSFTFPSLLCLKMPCWGWRLWDSVREMAGVWVYKEVRQLSEERSKQMLTLFQERETPFM